MQKREKEQKIIQIRSHFGYSMKDSQDAAIDKCGGKEKQLDSRLTTSKGNSERRGSMKVDGVYISHVIAVTACYDAIYEKDL